MAGRKRKAGSQRGRPRKAPRAAEQQTEGSAAEDREEAQGEKRAGRLPRGRLTRTRASSRNPKEEPPRFRGGNTETHDAVQATSSDDRSFGRGEEIESVAEEDRENEGHRNESYDSESDRQFEDVSVATTENQMDSVTRCIRDLTSTVKSLAEKVEKLERASVERNFSTIRNSDPDEHTEDDLRRDISAHSSTLPGESVTLNNIEVSNRPVMFTGGLRLGDHLPMNIKQKIWDNKFIEFTSILDPDSSDSYALSFNNTNQPTLCLTPKKKSYLNESDWTMAFDTFVAVYVQKFPEQLQDLLTYGNTIRKMISSGQAWWYYDRQFRIAREYSQCSWATMRVDLYMQNLNRNVQTYKPNFREVATIPTGYCFKYHSKEKRCFDRGCKFKHTCPRCDKPHPQYEKCFQDTRGHSYWTNTAKGPTSNSN